MSVARKASPEMVVRPWKCPRVGGPNDAVVNAHIVLVNENPRLARRWIHDACVFSQVKWCVVDVVERGATDHVTVEPRVDRITTGAWKRRLAGHRGFISRASKSPYGANMPKEHTGLEIRC